MNSLSLKITTTLCIITTLFSSIECSRSPPLVGHDLVTKVCKKTGYFNLCMTILYPDERIYTTDTKGLAKIVMEKDMNVAKEILSQVQSLAHDAHKPRHMREKCGKCVEEYKAIVLSLIPRANKSLDYGEYLESIKELKLASHNARVCDGEFSEGNERLPFENMSVHDISLVAASIVKTLV